MKAKNELINLVEKLGENYGVDSVMIYVGNQHYATVMVAKIRRWCEEHQSVVPNVTGVCIFE